MCWFSGMSTAQVGFFMLLIRTCMNKRLSLRKYFCLAPLHMLVLAGGCTFGVIIGLVRKRSRMAPADVRVKYCTTIPGSSCKQRCLSFSLCDPLKSLVLLYIHTCASPNCRSASAKTTRSEAEILIHPNHVTPCFAAKVWRCLFPPSYSRTEAHRGTDFFPGAD